MATGRNKRCQLKIWCFFRPFQFITITIFICALDSGPLIHLAHFVVPCINFTLTSFPLITNLLSKRLNPTYFGFSFRFPLLWFMSTSGRSVFLTSAQLNTLANEIIHWSTLQCLLWCISTTPASYSEAACCVLNEHRKKKVKANLAVHDSGRVWERETERVRGYKRRCK